MRPAAPPVEAAAPPAHHATATAMRPAGVPGVARFAALTAAIILPGPALACSLALVLALDVSASVDAREYRLQAEGTAAALSTPRVRRALAAGPVAVAATLWSGRRDQQVIADWVLLTDTAALEALAATIARAPRPAFDGQTATGAALAHAATLLARAPACARQVIDIATDDVSNAGPAPSRIPLPGIAVNALSIGGDLPLDHGSRAEEGGALTRWLLAEVTRGPGAFVEPADDYRDFARAMERKLLREIEGQPFAAR